MFIQFQAEYFLNAYHVLSENNNVIIKSLESTQENSRIGESAVAPRLTMGVEIVCLAFSVELYIKNVHYVANSEAPRGHDILKLFEDLPDQVQREIYTHPAIAEYHWDIEEFIQEIKSISDGFEKWRYSHEVSTLRYNTYFALIFIEALKSAACGVRKHSTVKNN